MGWAGQEGQTIGSRGTPSPPCFDPPPPPVAPPSACASSWSVSCQRDRWPLHLGQASACGSPFPFHAVACSCSWNARASSTCHVDCLCEPTCPCCPCCPCVSAIAPDACCCRVVCGVSLRPRHHHPPWPPPPPLTHRRQLAAALPVVAVVVVAAAVRSHVAAPEPLLLLPHATPSTPQTLRCHSTHSAPSHAWRVQRTPSPQPRRARPTPARAAPHHAAPPRACEPSSRGTAQPPTPSSSRRTT